MSLKFESQNLDEVIQYCLRFATYSNNFATNIYTDKCIKSRYNSMAFFGTFLTTKIKYESSSDKAVIFYIVAKMRVMYF